METVWFVLAQASQPGATPPPAGDALGRFIVPMLLMIGVFYFFLIRGQRKDRQRMQDMLNNLKRNDRVQTIGGVLGTVVDVRDHEVVLKVDENNNVKMRFNRSAIKEVLTADPQK